jgi:hypothetical protein
MIFMIDSVPQKAYFSLKHLSTESLPSFPQPVNRLVLGNNRIQKRPISRCSRESGDQEDIQKTGFLFPQE